MLSEPKAEIAIDGIGCVHWDKFARANQEERSSAISIGASIHSMPPNMVWPTHPPCSGALGRTGSAHGMAADSGQPDLFYLAVQR